MYTYMYIYICMRVWCARKYDMHVMHCGSLPSIPLPLMHTYEHAFLSARTPKHKNVHPHNFTSLSLPLSRFLSLSFGFFCFLSPFLPLSPSFSLFLPPPCPSQDVEIWKDPRCSTVSCNNPGKTRNKGTREAKRKVERGKRGKMYICIYIYIYVYIFIYIYT